MNVAATLANGAWLAASAPAWAAYRRALTRVRETQERRLLAVLRRNAESEFGRRHGFARIGSADDYRAAVPLTTYDALQPAIDRIAAGERAVLTAEPVRLFEPSSGSTRAAKWIPYTASLQREFRRAVAAWITELYRARPALAGGAAYWSISPALPRADDRRSVIPVGFAADSAYLGGWTGRIVEKTLAVPGALAGVSDPARHRRLTLLHLLRRRELRLISVWHPSFLALLLDELSREWDPLLAALARGDADPLAPPADPRRARELARLDPRDPRALWPRLALVSAWGDAHAALGCDSLRARFPGVEFQAKGLIATEAFVSLPFGGAHPLAVTSHFFEFLDERGDARLAHELERGRAYSVVVTTGGGLYRYRLHDRVEVAGFAGETPALRFLGKEDSCCDLRGEKLSEGFVAAALRSLFARHGMRPEFALLAPRAGDPPGYRLHLEAAAIPGGFPDALEAALRENPHYDHCVRLGQLAPAGCRATGPGAFARYAERLAARGQRLGNIKPAALSPLDGWEAVFVGD